jgi:hypothetical protein
MNAGADIPAARQRKNRPKMCSIKEREQNRRVHQRQPPATCTHIASLLRRTFIVPPNLPARPRERLATGWTVWGLNPGGGEIFRTLPDRPWGPLSILHNEHRVPFSGVNRSGRCVEHPPCHSAAVKESTAVPRPSLCLHGRLIR